MNMNQKSYFGTAYTGAPQHSIVARAVTASTASATTRPAPIRVQKTEADTNAAQNNHRSKYQVLTILRNDAHPLHRRGSQKSTFSTVTSASLFIGHFDDALSVIKKHNGSLEAVKAAWSAKANDTESWGLELAYHLLVALAAIEQRKTRGPSLTDQILESDLLYAVFDMCMYRPKDYLEFSGLVSKNLRLSSHFSDGTFKKEQNSKIITLQGVSNEMPIFFHDVARFAQTSLNISKLFAELFVQASSESQLAPFSDTIDRVRPKFMAYINKAVRTTFNMITPLVCNIENLKYITNEEEPTISMFNVELAKYLREAGPQHPSINTGTPMSFLYSAIRVWQANMISHPQYQGFFAINVGVAKPPKTRKTGEEGVPKSSIGFRSDMNQKHEGMSMNLEQIANIAIPNSFGAVVEEFTNVCIKEYNELKQDKRDEIRGQILNVEHIKSGAFGLLQRIGTWRVHTITENDSFGNSRRYDEMYIGGYAQPPNVGACAFIMWCFAHRFEMPNALQMYGSVPLAQQYIAMYHKYIAGAKQKKVYEYNMASALEASTFDILENYPQILNHEVSIKQSSRPGSRTGSPANAGFVAPQMQQFQQPPIISSAFVQPQQQAQNYANPFATFNQPRPLEQQMAMVPSQQSSMFAAQQLQPQRSFTPPRSATPLGQASQRSTTPGGTEININIRTDGAAAPQVQVSGTPPNFGGPTLPLINNVALQGSGQSSASVTAGARSTSPTVRNTSPPRRNQ